jgi:mannose-6-phosphate isomerase class I
MLTTPAKYDKAPYVAVSADRAGCTTGWLEILSRLRAAAMPGRFVICVECYPGVGVREIAEALEEGMHPALTVLAEKCFRAGDILERMLAPHLTGDPVFGRMTDLEISDFLDPVLVEQCRRAAHEVSGLVVIAGPGASVIAADWDLLIYCTVARWEIQQRQRSGEAGNLGIDNLAEPPQAKYKRAFFVDWRVADRLKCRLYEHIDFLLDANQRSVPKMISGVAFREGLEAAVHRPFRVVPFFDPGPWGGEWMRRTFDLPPDAPNYAWCFDCVPEENSLLLGFGRERVEIPASDVVFRHPLQLLGEKVYARFGAEFPIRFDLLDTVQGGNLSLQVHPLTEYIRDHFGMSYTQDESYYILDAAPDAAVYLGLKHGVDPQRMISDLKRAQEDESPFPVESYVNSWPARKHDHFLIPAGTIHCSGRNTMVLEVSATPYIFTFKLWDWGRVGLNGEPRPIHLDHGIHNVQWNRTTDWVRRELINRVEPLASGPGWTEERTGLHGLEFIETRRHWFTGPVPHDTQGTVNVLNLVEGDEAMVESPSGAFEPFPVHYAETFIVPAAVGHYTIRPVRNSSAPMATVKAFVRDCSE